MAKLLTLAMNNPVSNNCLPDGRFHEVGVAVVVVAVVERRAGQHHGDLAGEVGVVGPPQAVPLPGVRAAGKPHQTLPVLPPHPEGQVDLVVAQDHVVVELWYFTIFVFLQH